MVVGLEALQRLVAAVFVDRHLVGDPHPVGALVGLHVEDLLVERGRVVDDDDHLGLRVEVGAGLHEQLLDLVEVVGTARHHSPNPMRSRSWRSVSASTSSGASPPAHPPFVAGDHEFPHLGAQPLVEAGSVACGESSRRAHLGLDVERRFAAPLAPVGLRLEHLPRLCRLEWPDRPAAAAGRCDGGGIACSIANGPLPIPRQAGPERAKATAAIGSANSVIAAST